MHMAATLVQYGGIVPSDESERMHTSITDCKNLYGWFYLMYKKTYNQHKARYYLYRMRTLYKEGELGDFNKEVDSYSRDNEYYLPKVILTTPPPVPEVVDREFDKCDYLHQAREALHHLSTEIMKKCS